MIWIVPLDSMLAVTVANNSKPSSEGRVACDRRNDNTILIERGHVNYRSMARPPSANECNCIVQEGRARVPGTSMLSISIP